MSMSDRFIKYRGETHTVSEWVKLLHLDYDTVRMRLKRGTTDPDKLLRPADSKPKPVDLRAYLGQVMHDQLLEKAKYYKVSPADMAKHAIHQWLNDRTG